MKSCYCVEGAEVLTWRPVQAEAEGTLQERQMNELVQQEKPEMCETRISRGRPGDFGF